MLIDFARHQAVLFVACPECAAELRIVVTAPGGEDADVRCGACGKARFRLTYPATGGYVLTCEKGAWVMGEIADVPRCSTCGAPLTPGPFTSDQHCRQCGRRDEKGPG